MKKTFFLIFLTFLTLIGFSQTKKNNKDSIECLKKISLYKEFLKIQDFQNALLHWRKVYFSCPKTNKNIYIDGAKIFRYLIDNETNTQRKNKFLDTLFSLYDKRISLFGEEGFVLGKKSLDVAKYQTDSTEKIYKMTEKSVSLQKNKTEPLVFLTFVKYSVNFFKENKITKQKLLENYFLSLQYLDNQLSTENSAEKKNNISNAKIEIEKLILENKIFNCQILDTVFRKDFEKYSQNLDWLNKIYQYFAISLCKESEFLELLVLKINELAPSAANFRSLAIFSLRKNEIEKSISFYENAIKLSTDSSERFTLFYEIALLVYEKTENLEKSRNFCKNALQIDSKNGKIYFLLGLIYAAAAKNVGKNDFERKMVYCLAVDYFLKAKTLDSALISDAEKQISLYSQHFPPKEDAFFYNYKEGQTFQIEGWIQEKTTVKTRK